MQDIIASKRLREALPLFTALAAVLLAASLAALLHVGRDVFIPLALAILLSFVLAPLIRLLRKARLSRGVAVSSAVLAAFVVLLLLGGVIFGQATQLASDLPRYQANIRAKIESLQEATASTGVFGRALEVLQDLGEALEKPEGEGGAGSEADGGRPLPVEIREAPGGLLGTLGLVLAPLLHPLATAGLILIFAIFILLQREDLRNRFIRLAGTEDLQRTTAAIDDAARRLSRLLLMQVALNAGYGAVIGIGLWLIGVPSPVLWGIFAAVFRFVPYVGAVLGAALPLAMAAAVDPGWAMFAWTAALFVVIEPIVGHVIEPMLYGHSTGLSPVAVVLAAAFWAFLWGPIGLVLATPLTVCLVVLGRHVERLRFLSILLGDRPALAPHQIFYQRMLAGDPDEAVEQARELLKERALATYYDEVALEGIRLAQEDILRGAIAPERREVLERSIGKLVERLARLGAPGSRRRGPVNAEAAAAAEAIGPDRAIPVRAPQDLRPEWRGAHPVLCVAGQSALDEAVALMLAQLLTRHGLATRIVTQDRLCSGEAAIPEDDGTALICLSYLDAVSTVHIRYAARRLRRSVPGRPKLMVGLWRQRDPATFARLRRATSADVLVTSLHEALAAAVAMAGEPAPQAASATHRDARAAFGTRPGGAGLAAGGG